MTAGYDYTGEHVDNVLSLDTDKLKLKERDHTTSVLPQIIHTKQVRSMNNHIVVVCILRMRRYNNHVNYKYLYVMMTSYIQLSGSRPARRFYRLHLSYLTRDFLLSYQG